MRVLLVGYGEEEVGMKISDIVVQEGERWCWSKFKEARINLIQYWVNIERLRENKFKNLQVSI